MGTSCICALAVHVLMIVIENYHVVLFIDMHVVKVWGGLGYNGICFYVDASLFGEKLHI